MRQTVDYFAAQVVERSQVTDQITKFWPGDPRGSAQEAEQEVRDLRKEHPGAEYVLLERTLREVTIPSRRNQRRPK